MLYEYYNKPGVREICHDVKKHNPQAIETIATDLAQYVDKEDILIPAPQHTGKAEYTKKICESIREKTGAEIADILRCEPHKTLYEIKKEQKKKELDMSRIKIQMYLNGEYPKNKKLFFVDNVISTGYTYQCAKALIGNNLMPLIYAKGTRLKIKLEEPQKK